MRQSESTFTPWLVKGVITWKIIPVFSPLRHHRQEKRGDMTVTLQQYNFSSRSRIVLQFRFVPNFAGTSLCLATNLRPDSQTGKINPKRVTNSQPPKKGMPCPKYWTLCNFKYDLIWYQEFNNLIIKRCTPQLEKVFNVMTYYISIWH